MNEPKPVYQSRRFISAVSAVIAFVVIYYIPELEGRETFLVDHLTEIGLALIAGYTLQDIAAIIWQQPMDIAKLAEKVVAMLKKDS